jgi:inosose dehydratase
MRIGYNTWSMATVPYETFIPALSEIGFGAIAISVVPGYPIGGAWVENAAALDRLGPDDVRRIKQSMGERDLQLPSIIGNQSLVETDAQKHELAMDRLRRAIDLCVALGSNDGGTPTLNTGTGGRSGELESKEAMIVDRLGEIANYARERGVLVCIEPHVGGAVDTIERSEKIVQLINSPALKLDFDVSHFEVQAIPMSDSIPRLAPLAGAAEVKDQHVRNVSDAVEGDTWRVAGNGAGHCVGPDGQQLEFQFLLGGEGTFDLPQYLRMMQQLGFDEPIAFEASVQCQSRPGYDALTSARSIYHWMTDGWQRAGVEAN